MSRDAPSEHRAAQSGQCGEERREGIAGGDPAHQDHRHLALEGQLSEGFAAACLGAGGVGVADDDGVAEA
jgi:hypothetical protein